MFNISKKNLIFIACFILIISSILFYWNRPNIKKKIDKEVNLNTLKYTEIIKKIDVNNLPSLYQAENFIIKNHNIYGTLTALSLSKKYVLNNELNKALIALNNSLKYTKEENLEIILKLNIVKIKIEQNQNQQAIEILKKIQNHNWDNIVENMKGDIFMQIGNKKEAIKCWKKSLLTENSNASKEIINMKINDLKE